MSFAWIPGKQDIGSDAHRKLVYVSIYTLRRSDTFPSNMEKQLDEIKWT